MHRSAWLWLTVAVAVLSAGSPGSAQFVPRPQAEPAAPAQPAKKAKKPRAPTQEPALEEEDQLSPRQLDQRPPRAQTTQPPAAPPAPGQPPPGGAAQRQPVPDTPGAPAVQARPAEPARTIACGGSFGKESSHLKLAQRFDSRNITFTEVDGPEGTKLRASVLYPGDPKRRLEVLWQNEASRSTTHLIVINGQSTWSGPKGLRLGLSLAALEKLNGKPFKLLGFDQPNGGSVIDWQGGALATLPGGCRVGLRLAPDAKASEAARNEAAGKELASTDAKVRAVRPIVAEILFGY
jgi:hypothetical protein